MLARHKTECHNGPGYTATLPNGQRMIWAEEVKAVHNKGVVGIFVGVSNFYHAATTRDLENKQCIVRWVDF